MKKFKPFKLASLLLVLSVCTICAIGFTFAKYATSSTKTMEARIAKWGLTVTSTSEVNHVYGDGNEVSSVGEALVFAPGTSGKIAEFTLGGTAEVNATVTYTATITGDNWNSYFPLGLKLTHGTTEVTYSLGTPDESQTDKKFENVNALLAAVATDIEALDGKVAANSEESVPQAMSFTLSWNWPFGDGSTDTADTALGSAGSAPTLNVNITCSIAQDQPTNA